MYSPFPARTDGTKQCFILALLSDLDLGEDGLPPLQTEVLDQRQVQQLLDDCVVSGELGDDRCIDLKTLHDRLRQEVGKFLKLRTKPCPRQNLE